MPPNNLRSVAAQCRNFSTGSRGNLSSSRSRYVWRVVSMGSRLLTRATGVTFGVAIGYILIGDSVRMLEEERQKQMRDSFWWSFKEIEDLRPKMWHELREITLFQIVEKRWSQKMERMSSNVKEKIEMWFD